MSGFRAERIAELIHKELAWRLRAEVKDPRVTPISITSVEVSRDLRPAQISWMPLGGGDVTAELREGLGDVARQLRGRVGRALRLRYAPELVFEEDQHTEAAFRVTELLSVLAHERGRDDATEGEEE